MSVLRATSWGRTRGPKTLVGVQGGEVDVVLVASLDAVTDGYSTENQRYLHVMLVDKNVSTALTVTIYGYSHAFGKWFPLETLTQGLLNSSNAATCPISSKLPLVDCKVPARIFKRVDFPAPLGPIKHKD